MFGRRCAAMLTAPAAASLAVASLAVASLVGCTDIGGVDDADEEPDAEEAALPPAIVAPRASPFCQGIIDLENQLIEDPGDDPEGLVLATYEELLPVAPPEIAEDLAAIIAGQEGQEEVVVTDPPPADPDPNAPPGTDIDDPHEGFEPLATPAGRLATYISTNCDGVSSNPGPPPTVPFADTVADDG